MITVTNFEPHKSLVGFASNICVFEIEADTQPTVLPFFPDGFPGIIYQDAGELMTLGCKGKPLSKLFVYGQTIDPLELEVNGPCRMVIVQVYPEIPFYLFDVNAREMNNDCADLAGNETVVSGRLIERLGAQPQVMEQVSLLTRFLQQAIRFRVHTPDERINLAIRSIIDNKGMISISRLRANLFMTERTFERQFINTVGVGPKLFARIIQFRQSLSQMTGRNPDQLTDVVYDNGFADHSHFIRSFKRFTGKTPRVFQRYVRFLPAAF